MTPEVESEPSGEWQQRIRDRWDERVEWWDEMSQTNARSEARVHDLDRTSNALNLSPGSRVLDAGCGTGQWAIAFAKRGYVVSGIDIAPAMIERARQHSRDEGVSIDWRVGDYTALVANDQLYDAIHARVSLQFVESAYQTLLALGSALTPNGRLFVSVPGAASPIYSTTWRRFLPNEAITINYITPWDLERLLAELGWTVLDQWGDLNPSHQNQLVSGFQSPEDRLRVLQTFSTTWGIVATR